MQKRLLGSDWVSLIGLGTVKIGRNQQVKYPQPFNIPDDAAVKKLLETALECEINLIDTAPAYGNSEERLGKLLPGKRSDWHMVTKVGEEFEHGVSRFDFSAAHIRKSIERSLKLLRTDYLDTVLVHSNGDDLDIINRFGALDILAELKAKGLIRFYGMSTKTVEGGLLALEKSDVVMATYNLQETEDKPVFKKAAELSKAMLVKKAFASGHLPTHDDGLKIFQQISRMNSVSSVVIGTTNPQHLRGNVELMLEALTKN
jgi:aryl-alcohol dehydrogenase-like predicted oxidoreductase